MDIAALSMQLSQMNVRQAAGTSVLKMAMEAAEVQMEVLVEPMEALASAEPHLGNHIDVSV